MQIDGDADGRPVPPAEDIDWQPVIAFSDALSRADELEGRVVFERVDDRIFTMPTVEPSAVVDDFLRTLYEQQVVAGFDWGEWLGARGHELFNRDALGGATLEECRMLLAAHARQDRFVHGHFSQMASSGHLATVVARIAELVRRR